MAQTKHNHTYRDYQRCDRNWSGNTEKWVNHVHKQSHEHQGRDAQSNGVQQRLDISEFVKSKNSENENSGYESKIDETDKLSYNRDL